MVFSCITIRFLSGIFFPTTLTDEWHHGVTPLSSTIQSLAESMEAYLSNYNSLIFRKQESIFLPTYRVQMLVTPIPSQCVFEQWLQLRDCPDTALCSGSVHQVRSYTDIRPRLLQDPRSSLCLQNARPFPSCVPGQRYLLFITLNLLHVVSSCRNNFPGGCQPAVLLESATIR